MFQCTGPDNLPQSLLVFFFSKQYVVLDARTLYPGNLGYQTDRCPKGDMAPRLLHLA